MSGVLENWQVRVHVYRRGTSGVAPDPLTFGLSSMASLNRGNALSSVEIVRRINDEAQVTVILPSAVSPNGNRWADLIDPGDWIRIEAVVKRTPDALSDNWRTIFFGVVHSPRDKKIPAGASTSIFATCAIGWLKSNKYNYWVGVAGTFGNGQSTLFQRLLGEGGRDALYASTAKLLNTLMQNLIYTAFPMERGVQVGTQQNPKVQQMKWRDTHAYRFESDGFAQGFSLDQFAPHAMTWLQSLMNIIDAPAFYQIYCDVVPRSRIMSDANIGTGEAVGQFRRIFKKDGGWAFPCGNGYADKEFVDAIIVRPLPFPEYHDPSIPWGVTGYDSRAWDRLPTLSIRENVGALSIDMGRNLFEQYTYFSTELMAVQSSVSTDVTAAFIVNSIFDLDKYNGTVGYQPYVVSTRRLYIVRAVADERDGNLSLDADASKLVTSPKIDARTGGLIVDDKTAFSQAVELGQFVEKLNESLFSYHQYADKYEAGTIESPLDLRMELGSRLIFGNGKKIGFVDGYTHTFTAEEAYTVPFLTRVLPIETYQQEMPKYLGRKRLYDKDSPTRTRAVPLSQVEGEAVIPPRQR